MISRLLDLLVSLQIRDHVTLKPCNRARWKEQVARRSARTVSRGARVQPPPGRVTPPPLLAARAGKQHGAPKSRT